MSNKEEVRSSDNWITIFLGAIAIYTIKSLFVNDNSKIVSEKGKDYLYDADYQKQKKLEDIIDHADRSLKDIYI